MNNDSLTKKQECDLRDNVVDLRVILENCLRLFTGQNFGQAAAVLSFLLPAKTVVDRQVRNSEFASM